MFPNNGPPAPPPPPPMPGLPHGPSFLGQGIPGQSLPMDNPWHQIGYVAGYQFGVIFGAFFVGVLCGLLPLLLGQKRGQQTLGIVGMVVCVGAGLLLGLTGAVPSALLFGGIILTMSKSR